MKQIKILILITFVVMTSNLASQNHSYSNKEIASDLAYLKTELEQNHPNLYTYSSKEQIDEWFKTKSSNLPDSLTDKEAFKIITSISGLLKDGHSYMYPNARHLEEFFKSAPLFPLDVFLMNDNLIVVGNHSNEQNIPLGVVLTRINGIEIKEIQSLIVQHTCRDGNNLAYPKHLFYQFFPAFYSYFYGFYKSFQIEYITPKGEQKEIIIQGLRRSEIKAKKENQQEKGIDIKLLLNKKAAFISIKSFDQKILKNDYHQKFKKEIKKAFKLLEEEDIEHLAIDLRDNQGGALSNGVYLLQHFMDSAFQCVNSYFVLKNGKRKRLHIKWDNYFEPKKKNHFDGKVYIFINGGSYSCSAIVANSFKENKRGQVLGQMSGGSAYVNSGGPNERITLPNTKILFTIPKTQYNLRSDLEEIVLGVIPDIEIQDKPDRIIEKKDNFIDKFKELTKE
ncbi:MAG: S41 family peptidase [Bacteroidia bacterium]